jgi:recombination protein RecA
MKEKEEKKEDKSKIDQSKFKILVENIEKAWGKGSIMKIDDNKSFVNTEVIPSGSIGLDIALGIGGYPMGRIIEIYGPESSGKTTLALHVIAESQKMGGMAAFIDVEYAFDKDYAKNLGVIVEGEKALYISQPSFGEEALDIVNKIVVSGLFNIVVVDSVAALVPKSELEGQMGDSSIGLQARLMSQSMRKLVGIISKMNCSVIFINQLRDRIGIVYGSPEVTTGGNALKFYASIRLDVRRILQLKDGEEILGSKTRVKVVKNKMAPPFKKTEFDIMFGKGISKEGEIVDLGSELNIIKKSGSWYSYGETKLGQGKEAVVLILKDNPELMKELEEKIKAQILGEIEEV